MPIKIPDKLPAKKILEKENVFVMGKKRALHQDIRPLHIALLNLMPTKIETETQIARMLSNTPLQIELELVHTASHKPTHTTKKHLDIFYKTFEQVKHRRFDGLIITGAPVEQLPFEKVDYWDELTEILQWAEKNVTSTLYLCWAAQAALYFHYGIKKYFRKQKVFGVFPHKILKPKSPLLRGFDDGFLVPHSRHTEVRKKDIVQVKDLEILAISDEAGIHIVSSSNGSKIFAIGHSEYDYGTLQFEYVRDKGKGLPITIPKNYFPDNDPSRLPTNSWRSHGFLFFSNWLNYYVYQTTPYDWTETKVKR